jgi:hypothetical protein
MIKILVEPHHGDVEPNALEGTYDIYVDDGNSGNRLLFSNQGYENVAFAQRLVKRLFGSKAVWSETVGVSPDFTVLEPVVLVTHYADGKSKTEQIR